MYCPNCGAENDANNYQCVNCGTVLPRQEEPAYDQGYQAQGAYQEFSSGGPPPNIPNHMVKAILTTLFCCLPAGVVAIVYAAQVNGKIQAGDYEGAQQSSKNADLWGNISLGVGVVVGILYVLVMIASEGNF